MPETTVTYKHLNNKPATFYMATTVLNPLTPKGEKLASHTVTISRKAEIPACRSLIYSRKAIILAWKFREEKTVTNNVVSGSSGSGDSMLWELRGERVN